MDNHWRGRFTLADGREVFLTRLLLTHTYAGVLEGSPATVSRSIRKSIADRVARELTPDASGRSR